MKSSHKPVWNTPVVLSNNARPDGPFRDVTCECGTLLAKLDLQWPGAVYVACPKCGKTYDIVPGKEAQP